MSKENLKYWKIEFWFLKLNELVLEFDKDENEHFRYKYYA